MQVTGIKLPKHEGIHFESKLKMKIENQFLFLTL